MSVRPAHGVTDGDTAFAVATGETTGGPEVITAAANVFARALVHAVLAARSVVTGWGHVAAYHPGWLDRAGSGGSVRLDHRDHVGGRAYKQQNYAVGLVDTQPGAS